MIARDRKAITWGFRLVLGAIVAFRLLPWAIRESQEAVEIQRVQRSQLEHAKAEVAGLPALEDSARWLRTRLVAMAGRLVSGSTEAAALSDLSAHLKSRAWRSQARMQRVELVPDSAAAGQLRRLTAVATFEGDARSIAGLLTAFDTEAPLIVPLRMGVVARDPLGEIRGSEVLEIEIQVAAWYLLAGK